MNRISQLFTNEPVKQQRINRALWWAIAAAFIFQMYFVRELLAAEFLFGAAFAVLFLIGFVIYLLGRAGERGFSWAESRARALTNSARRGLSALDEISRRTFRHPRSESAQ
jgi:hypothetical protein